jgi:serine/threonine-protein kinase
MQNARKLNRVDTTLADPLVGRLLDGRYRVESRIARGGMATVYLALDIRLDRTVALKVMHRSLAEDPAFVRRFIGEAKSVASLSHPNVVHVFDQGTDGDLVYLSMEYVPGRTLRDVLRERGRLAPREALELMIPVLAALGAAHQKGMVHRDVKPENVLLADDGRVKVVDFGLARAIEASNQTRTGVMIGTIGYMSPEQVTAGHADERSDVYSAGVMLFELVTGRQPYEGDSPMSVAYQHVHDTVPSLSAVLESSPPVLDALVAAATSRDPQARPADATAFLVAAVEAHRVLPRDSTPPRTASHASVPLPGLVQPVNHTLLQPRAEVMTGPAVAAGPAHGVRRGRVPKWLLISLAAVMAVAVGVTGWWFAQGQYVKVPELVNKNLTVAKSEAEGRGFVVVIADGLNDRKVVKDNVLKMDPAPGTEVASGAKITLVPSLGPKLIPVPNLEGLTEAAARARLSEAGLGVDDVSKVPNVAVQRGLVLSTNPQVGSKVKEGGRVDLVLSAGLLMPDVMGMPREQAEQFLREQGFNVEFVEQADDAQPCTVIAQEPSVKAEVDKGATAKLTLSQCANPGWRWPWENEQQTPEHGSYAIVPNVMYKNVKDAQQELRAAGFKVKVRKLMGSDRVRGQRPAGGAAPPQTEVTIWH